MAALAFGQSTFKRLQSTSQTEHLFHCEQRARVALNANMFQARRTRFYLKTVRDLLQGGDIVDGEGETILPAELNENPNQSTPGKPEPQRMQNSETSAGNESEPESANMVARSRSSTASKRKRDHNSDYATEDHSESAETSADDESTAKKRKMLKNTPQHDDYTDSTREESFVSRDRRKKTSEKSRHGDAKAGKKSKKDKRKKSAMDDQSAGESSSVSAEDLDGSDGPDYAKEPKSSNNKHAGILSKFERSKRAASVKPKRAEPEVDEPIEEVEPVFAKGLEPLPQPEQPEEEENMPTYSSLPEWLANPQRTLATERAKFSELGIEPGLLRTLDQNGYNEAFAVQSAVIPLLLEGNEKHHRGDLCVSAATGSGKTLSYVLPMVNSISPRPASRLRGLIVVPTRELVRQARETCELLASGSGLHIGSAVGNVAIKDEQKFLMRVDQVYSPETVAKRQHSSLRGNDWMDFSLEDCVAEALDSAESLPGYIQRAEPNIDILICTPGRLVDHIRYTKGFTLKYLEWLVIDEADRLLNESFQEWVDVVMNSLNARETPEAFRPGGDFLARLGLAIETKPPKKVILSATMTRDITKLNSLHLSNPKMVILGGGNAADSKDTVASSGDAHYDLPSTLREYSVAVGDDTYKPLYLMRLLTTYIKVQTTPESRAASPSSDSESTSSDDSSDYDTNDDESDDDTPSSVPDSESEITAPSGPAGPTVLIFAKSSESASRLARLISLYRPSLASTVGTIIKSNKSAASRKTLAAYRRGRISIIVATDRASRGLDLESLNHVVNYDVPASATTYVHRVGRTARAGRDGSAWTLVAHREGKWFASEIAASGANSRITRATPINRFKIKLDLHESDQRDYRAALDTLEKEVKSSQVQD